MSDPKNQQTTGQSGDAGDVFAALVGLGLLAAAAYVGLRVLGAVAQAAVEASKPSEEDIIRAALPQFVEQTGKEINDLTLAACLILFSKKIGRRVRLMATHAASSAAYVLLEGMSAVQTAEAAANSGFFSQVGLYLNSGAPIASVYVHAAEQHPYASPVTFTVDADGQSWNGLFASRPRQYRVNS